MYGLDTKFSAGKPYRKSTSVRIDSDLSPRSPLKLREEDAAFVKCQYPMLSVPAPRGKKSDGRMRFEGSGARYATVSSDLELRGLCRTAFSSGHRVIAYALPAMFPPVH